VNWIAPLALAGVTPVLLAHHDTLLEALSASAVSMVTGGALARVGRASLLLVVLAPLCGIALADVFYWWAGRRWGERIAAFYRKRSPRSGRWIETADRWVLRHGVRTVAVAYFLPVPNALVFLSCGTAGMPLATFVVGDIIGTLLWTALLVEIGWTAGRQGVRIVDAVQHYELVLVLAVVVLAVAVGVLRRRRASVARYRA
jgi:membrane protein DedA with SNARE-associated domain